MDIISVDMKNKPSKLYAEIRQSKPFAKLERELAVAVLRTGDVFHHGVDHALAPFGISMEQYNALRILRGAGEAGHPTLEISRRLISRSPNLTRLLDKLVEKDLAIRERGLEDRRQALLRITPKGLALLADCDRATDASLAKLSCLSAAEMRQLVELLDRAREAVAIRTVWEGLLGDKSSEPPKPQP
jgi:DNA-binding MarR family transcriptional regulator